MTNIASRIIFPCFAAAFALALAQLAAPAAQAADYDVGSIHIAEPWARATPKGATSGAAYCFTLHGWTPDEAFFDDSEYGASEYEASSAAASAGSNVTNVPRRPKDKPQQSTAGASSRNARGRLR